MEANRQLMVPVFNVNDLWRNQNLIIYMDEKSLVDGISARATDVMMSESSSCCRFRWCW